MKSTERLEELLDLKDERISELEGELEEIREREEREEWRWALHRTVKNDEGLPVPRLEIRCTRVSETWHNYRWQYALIYKHLLDHFVAVPMGETTTNGSIDKPPIFSGEIRLPFRDGVHIAHDAETLDLPAFALCDGLIQRVQMVEGKIKLSSVGDGNEEHLAAPVSTNP